MNKNKKKSSSRKMKGCKSKKCRGNSILKKGYKNIKKTTSKIVPKVTRGLGNLGSKIMGILPRVKQSFSSLFRGRSTRKKR